MNLLDALFHVVTILVAICLVISILGGAAYLLEGCLRKNRRNRKFNFTDSSNV